MSEHLDHLAVQTIRGLSMDAVQQANSGHPGTPMALAPLGWLIFSKLRRHDPKHPNWPGRDRFVLSCGHASMLQYSLLHLSGYDLSLDDIKNFRQWDSKTPGHPEVFHTAGVETTTGPLGQGVGNAVGMAMAQRHLQRRFDSELFDHTIWTIASDGDLMEGVAAEAASLAGHLKLGSLVVFWDDNNITIDGRTDLAFTEDVCGRFAACGWHVLSVDDGNDLAALEKAAKEAQADPRPSFIRVKTVIGDPSPNKKDTSGIHGAPLGADEIAATKAVMNWPAEPFHVPGELKAATDAILSKGAADFEAWQAKLQAYATANPDDAAALHSVLGGELPAGWEEALPSFEADAKGMASRAASGKIIAAAAKAIPHFVGGSADLTGSNKTAIEGDDFRFEREGVPRYAYWGVREHGMGSAMNGMALYGGVMPFGATFLVFADYMRPAIRLAALMGLPTRYIFSHDSIGLGEDGPTHQPIEHLASLRAIPNLLVLRPCDANETREAWIAALKAEGPSCLVLSRQNLPTLGHDASGAQKGGYAVKDCAEPKAVLVATGSEVHIALDAAAKLEADGVATRVVSMPSWELFGAQTQEYRDNLIPAGAAKVVVEAGSRFGWERWVGNDAGFVTIERFGASAPADVLYEKLGVTAEAAVAAVKARL